MLEPTTETPRPPRTGELIRPLRDEADAISVRVSRPKSARPKPAGWLAYLVLIILTLAGYAPIFKSDLHWSEYDQVERSPYQSMETWKQAWALGIIRSEDPITLSSYFLEQALPLRPVIAHHAINLLLHALAAVLLLKTLDALKLPAAFSASLVFALHPAVLQTIFWSGFRSELIGLVLLLGALFFGVRNRNARDFACLIAISALAFCLHPATLVLPLILTLCVFYQNKSSHLRNYNYLLPLFCLSLFIAVWTQANQTGQNFLFGERISIYAQNLFFYFKQALLPLDLALFHPFKHEGGYRVGAQNSLLPFLLFLPPYVLFAINFRKSWARGLLLGLTAYLLLSIYSISSNGAFIDGKLAHEDHLLYIGLPVIVAVVVCSFGAIARTMGSSGRILWFLGFTAFALFQFILTASYAYRVSDAEQLWHDISQQWPDAWLPKLALIHTIQDSGSESELLNQSEIIELLEDILSQQPDLIEERQLLARIYLKDRQNTNALREYRRILRDSKPDNDFLREAADFYDSLGLNWDANNVRERITQK
jgi:hypothetical protein